MYAFKGIVLYIHIYINKKSEGIKNKLSIYIEINKISKYNETKLVFKKYYFELNRFSLYYLLYKALQQSKLDC